MITIRVEKPNRPEIATLIAELDAYLDALYPPEASDLMDIETLMQDDILFVAAKDGERYVGCGALRMVPGQYGEVKRMYVVPDQRGKCVGYAILAEVEKLAAERGFKVLKLETGVRQDEALNLYRKFGFRETARFGEYQEDPLCLYFEKRVSPVGATT